MDCLLVEAPDLEACHKATADLLRELAQLGYRVSVKKAQLCQKEVTYLGYILKRGKQMLSQAWKETILNIPTPCTRRQVCGFLGLTAGFCRLPIPGFIEIAKQIIEATSGQEGILYWTPEMVKVFERLKKALLEALALDPQDIYKLFHLCVDENKGIAKGILTPTLGPKKRPVAYLCKQLDPVAKGWPPCLCMVAVTALLVKDEGKITMRQLLWL